MVKNSLNKDVLKTPLSCEGLFDNIINTIKLEEESKATRKLLFIFFVLLLVSLVSLPFSLMYVILQWQTSGVSYFISTTFSNLNMFLHFWQDFLLSIMESFPIIAVILFATNIALLLFTINLFLHKKSVLLKYLYGRK